MKFPLFLFRTRVVLLLATLSLFAVFVYRTFLSTSSISGVLCAPVVNVTAPVEGSIERSVRLDAGVRVSAGQPLMKIHNDRFDEQSLLETRSALQQAVIDRERIAGQLQQVRRELADELRRMSTARGEQIDILRARLARDEHYVDEATVKAKALARQTERQASLAEQGFIARIGYDNVKANWEEAEHHASAQRSNLEADRRMYEALSRGADIDDSAAPQVAAVRMRISTLRDDVQRLTTELASAIKRQELHEATLRDHDALSQRLKSADIQAGANGIVIQTLPDATQYTPRGASLFSYADCDRPHVMVLLKQRVYARLGAGDYREIGVTVAGKRYSGKVAALSPVPFGERSYFPTVQGVILKPDVAGEYGYALIRIDGRTNELRSRCSLGAVAEIDVL